MSIIDKIKADQLAARKNKDGVAASLLTTLMSAAMMVAKNAGKDSPTDAEVIAEIRKFQKGNAEMQKHASSPEVLKTDPAILGVAKREAEILESYMPKQLSEQELRDHISAQIAAGTKDMGGIMAFLKANFVGLYDGKMASTIAKELL